jgi:hypothetical protein
MARKNVGAPQASEEVNCGAADRSILVDEIAR